MLNGQPLDFTDRIRTNLFKVLGLTKYSIDEAKNNSISSAIESETFVPLGLLDNVGSDLVMMLSNPNLTNLEKLKALDTFQDFPVIGKLLYRWFGEPRMTQ